MAVPRNRLSNSRKNLRRSHHAMKKTGFSSCSHCSSEKLPHRVCLSCGYYNGRKVLAAQEA